MKIYFKSQTLSYEEILTMRDSLTDSKEIIETIIANSKSFNEKTEFSQEKYIKKKEKKYFEFIQIRKPTLRLLTEIFYRQDPEKALGLRIDSLSQLISYSGVSPSAGNILMFESGTSGLVPAAFLNSMGEHGNARLIHLHPGNFPQLQAVYALNLPINHLNKCISVNIYSVLRQYYQDIAPVESTAAKEEPISIKGEATTESETTTEIDSNRKRKHENGTTENDVEDNPSKRPNLFKEKEEEKVDENLETAVVVNVDINSAKVLQREIKKQKWQLENEEAVKLFKEKFDSLTVVAKEDPFPIVKELLPFVHHSRPVVIFHTNKEVLMECYGSLKANNSLINLRLVTNFMRNYQVLPMRTHPAVQIQGSSGWLLYGYTINNERNN